MNPFILPRAAILDIIEGLVLEHDKAHGQTIRSLLGDTLWDENLIAGEGGLGVEAHSVSDLHGVVTEFFDLPAALLRDCGPTIPLGVWVDHISKAVQTTMTRFHFRPAGDLTGDGVCTHRVDALFQEAAGAASLLQGRRRLVSMVSPHSLMGFIITVLVPALLRIEVINARKMPLDVLCEELAFGDVIVATPTFWAYLMNEGVSAPDNSMGVCFGELMTMDLAASMRRNGLGVLRELYGSTQSGIVAWRGAPDDSFVLFDHWSRDLDVDDGLLRHYPDLECQSLKPMDYFKWKNNRSFSLAGRRDGAVQIGAVNVFPQKIAALLMQCRAVDQCNVRVAMTTKGINRLIADIYLPGKQAADAAIAREIDLWCRAHLAVHERPHILNLFVME